MTGAPEADQDTEWEDDQQLTAEHGQHERQPTEPDTRVASRSVRGVERGRQSERQQERRGRVTPERLRCRGPERCPEPAGQRDGHRHRGRSGAGQEETQHATGKGRQERGHGRADRLDAPPVGSDGIDGAGGDRQRVRRCREQGREQRVGGQGLSVDDGDVPHVEPGDDHRVVGGQVGAARGRQAQRGVLDDVRVDRVDGASVHAVEAEQQHHDECSARQLRRPGVAREAHRLLLLACAVRPACPAGAERGGKIALRRRGACAPVPLRSPVAGGAPRRGVPVLYILRSPRNGPPQKHVARFPR